MKLIAVSLAVFLCACGSKKDDPPKTEPKTEAKTETKTEKADPVEKATEKTEKTEKAEKTEKTEKTEKAEAGSGAKKFEFDALSEEEKIDFMKKKVVPEMKIAFQKHDAKEFEKFNCKTCHGKDPKASKYKMPNPDLPKLDFEALKAGKDEKLMKAAKWMAEVVTPTMAKILEEEPYSEKNPKGFGCLACHEQKK
ncbi:MAG: hypothetical protein KIT31_08340 [Deltaproteobacteria bacterium]|nr:hypothetical protein [Deltaproteobacteria bacterium]